MHQSRRAVVIVPCRNAERWIPKCLHSLRRQRLKEWRALVVDDASTDCTYDQVLKAARRDSRIELIRNPVRRGAALSRWNGLRSLASVDPGDVVVLLDGDDWLSTRSALQRIVEFQAEGGLAASYGNHRVRWRRCAWAASYPPDVIADGTYRQAAWRASHPRAFRYGLLAHVPDSEMYDEFGEPLMAATDMALFFNVLELAGAHQGFCPIINYVYNRRGGATHAPERVKAQRTAEATIRSRMPRLPLLPEQVREIVGI